MTRLSFCFIHCQYFGNIHQLHPKPNHPTPHHRGRGGRWPWGGRGGPETWNIYTHTCSSLCLFSFYPRSLAPNFAIVAGGSELRGPRRQGSQGGSMAGTSEAFGHVLQHVPHVCFLRHFVCSARYLWVFRTYGAFLRDEIGSSGIRCSNGDCTSCVVGGQVGFNGFLGFAIVAVTCEDFIYQKTSDLRRAQGFDIQKHGQISRKTCGLQLGCMLLCLSETQFLLLGQNHLSPVKQINCWKVVID